MGQTPRRQWRNIDFLFRPWVSEAAKSLVSAAPAMGAAKDETDGRIRIPGSAVAEILEEIWSLA
jgi:hypothetical protein